MKRHITVVLSLVLCLVAFTIAWRWHTAMPRYGGKTLRQWMREYDLDQTPDQRQRTDYAVQMMGPQVLPYILSDMSLRHDTERELKVNTWLIRLHLGRFGYPFWETRRNRAYSAFCALKSRVDVVPYLLRLYRDAKGNDKERRQYYVLETISSLGPDGKGAIPFLLEEATNNTSQTRPFVLSTLGRIHQDPDAVVPVLIRGLNDADFRIRLSAAEALGDFGANGRNAVAALINELQDPDDNVRRCTVYALGRIGPDAKNAVPALTRIASDAENAMTSWPKYSPDYWAHWHVRNDANSALDAINAKVIFDSRWPRTNQTQSALQPAQTNSLP